MIQVQNVTKIYKEGERELTVLHGLNLQIPPAQKIGIIGSSGAGKSTLLHILGGLDRPSTGSVTFEEKEIYRLSEEKLARFRNLHLGFIFQFYHLLPELTALENVALPAWIAGKSRKEGVRHAEESLDRVGLKDRLTFLPKHLSGGECQRVALARACVLKPKVILADEPTGNLDEETGGTVYRYLLEVVEEVKGILIMVTHNRELVKNLDQTFELKNGTLHAL
ncbi:MAG: ABC transporter ATP-binding protein [Deltaproteobacteria bacterium]|nr:ABC transporter ATP-binding protein [Deltaproteobacteria bacterium]